MISIIEKSQIMEAGKKLNHMNLAPATSGNYSLRLDDEFLAMTVSGVHKGFLKEADIIVIDYDGKSQDSTKKPSAETLLHTMIYQLYPKVGAVLHTHSVNSTVLSKIYEKNKKLILHDYELQKVFSNIETHESTVSVAIFKNSQNMNALSNEVQARLPQELDALPGFLIAGHGLYAWGETMADALRHVEAFEFLFSCEMEMLRLIQGGVSTTSHSNEVGMK